MSSMSGGGGATLQRNKVERKSVVRAFGEEGDGGVTHRLLKILRKFEALVAKNNF